MNEYINKALEELEEGSKEKAINEVMALFNAYMDRRFGVKPNKKEVKDARTKLYSWNEWQFQTLLQGKNAWMMAGLAPWYLVNPMEWLRYTWVKPQERQFVSEDQARCMALAKRANRPIRTWEELHIARGISFPEESRLNNTALTIEEREELAIENGWCRYHHKGEQPFIYKGWLLHISETAAPPSSYERGERPFIYKGWLLHIREARKSFNKELSETEWEELITYLQSGGYDEMLSRLEARNPSAEEEGGLEVLELLEKEYIDRDSARLRVSLAAKHVKKGRRSK